MDYRPLLTSALALATLSACDKPAQTPTEPVSRTDPASLAAHVAAAHAHPPVERIEDGMQAELIEAAPKIPTEPSLAWIHVASFSAPVDFAPLDEGVVLRAGDQQLALSEGELVAAPAKTFTRGTPQGRWPDNAWVSQTRIEERAGLYLRMSKWKGNNRWVPQTIKDPPEDLWANSRKWYETYGDFWGHVGGRGGYLLALYSWDEEVISFRRLAGKNFAPVDWAWNFDDEDLPLDIIEAPSGRVFVFSRGDDEGLRVDERGFCRTRCEVERHELAATSEHLALGRSVALDDEHIAIGLLADYDDESASALLTGGAGEWTVNEAPVEGGAFFAYLPGAAGELFAVVGQAEGGRGHGEQLWHRDREGQWQALTLPEELAPHQALHLDLAKADADTMWIAVDGADSHDIYALPAALG